MVQKDIYLLKINYFYPIMSSKPVDRFIRLKKEKHLFIICLICLIPPPSPKANQVHLEGKLNCGA